jgi:hypothetical protein
MRSSNDAAPEIQPPNGHVQLEEAVTASAENGGMGLALGVKREVQNYGGGRILG